MNRKKETSSFRAFFDYLTHTRTHCNVSHKRKDGSFNTVEKRRKKELFGERKKQKLVVRYVFFFNV